MPRLTKQQQQEAALAARPFANDSTDPYAGRSDEERKAVALAIFADKVAGFSGDELRSKYGPRLTGHARREVFRTYDETRVGGIGPSYPNYRDKAPRKGSRHAREHGALAEARRADALAEAQQALEAASKAPKGRSKASKAAHAEALAAAEARVTALAGGAE